MGTDQTWTKVSKSFFLKNLTIPPRTDLRAQVQPPSGTQDYSSSSLVSKCNPALNPQACPLTLSWQVTEYVCSWKGRSRRHIDKFVLSGRKWCNLDEKGESHSGGQHIPARTVTGSLSLRKIKDCYISNWLTLPPDIFREKCQLWTISNLLPPPSSFMVGKQLSNSLFKTYGNWEETRGRVASKTDYRIYVTSTQREPKTPCLKVWSAIL